MDEADGRLGPQAQQSAPADVLMDAPAKSLCRIPAKTNPPIFRARPRLLRLRARVRTYLRIAKENCHENLPGK